MLLKEYQAARRRSSNNGKHVSKDKTQQFPQVLGSSTWTQPLLKCYVL
ncbi:unnamed protein product [Urochloa humidicola]